MTPGKDGAGGGRTFIGLALVILLGLVFAAGVMVGRQLGIKEREEDADVLSRIDKRDREPPFPERKDLVYPDVLSQTNPSKVKIPLPPSVVPRTVVEAPPRAPVADAGVAPAPAAEAVAKYTLQVASYREAAQAQELIMRLSSKGYAKIRLLEGEVGGKGKFFRVRLGLFASKEDAERIQQKLEREEGLKVMVISNET